MSSRDQHSGELRKGLILLAVGGWFLLNTLGAFDLAYQRSWPLLLILIGLAMTIAPDRRECFRGVRPGVFVMAWGALAWIAESRLWGFGWNNIWPLFLVCAGLAMVWRALGGERRAPSTPESGSDQ